jgi:hypothetical protein
MRLVALLVAICAMSQSAQALTSGCKTIPDAGARLACYDKANPLSAPIDKSAATKAAAPMPARTPGAKAGATNYVDTIGEEDARMNAQLKNICRGC